MAFTLPELPYPYDALEPYIDARTMEIHHTKHHAGYVNKLNGALEGLDQFLSMDINELVLHLDEVPEEKRQAVINNGGGHHNHSLFWVVMAPAGQGGGGQPSGELAEAIGSVFGSFENFKEQFSTAAAALFGSGWTWLVVEGGGGLKILTTPNQNPPQLVDKGYRPILGLDVWEHAYYLKYQNRRPDYIAAWWNVVNWPKVQELYLGYRG